MKHCKLLMVFVLLSAALAVPAAYAGTPVTTDSRIKTLVYSENEVFHLVIHYGYQSVIEFGKNEETPMVALGTPYAWRVDRVGNRLFIRALEGSAHTNMTVISNKRTYQFDLESKDPSNSVDDELVYVVRFYYPDENLDQPRPVVDTQRFNPQSTPTPSSLEAPQSQYNFNYTLSGPDNIAPVKVFDDGQATYLQFANNNALIPHIFVVSPDGKEDAAHFSRKGEYIVVGTVTDKIALRLGQDTVYIYNEQNQHGPL